MRVDVEFTSGGVTLRGWLYEPVNTAAAGVPLVVMTHGFAGVKEWVAPFAEVFSKAGLACLVYDHRGFGTSDGEPRYEVDPMAQVDGYRDAITFAQTLDGIDPDRIAVWGTSFAGAHALVVAAIDRRVRAVVSQVPLTHGWAMFSRLVSPIALPAMHEAIAADRLARAAGKPYQMIKSASDDPTDLVAMPGADVYEWLMANGPQIPTWRNEVTLSSVDKLQSYAPEAFLRRVSPTPLLMVIADNDTLTPTDVALTSYAEALEPKQLELIPGGHFEVYGERFDQASSAARNFLLTHLAR
ncbi:alpha/beta hydrolase [Nocardia sp. NBC_00508]|uniref:alpha/beta hydrolase n=1 Tax=Nocardia sp. NBC_00508 TaxID=2975992 RepID=UPI002E805E6A|nr:alpha/beta fold hydrolase [Nocardia sp. NBC_00508]WUD66033.1 alpha/beta hydrolase [Nocardia sp. NBC_00508]